MTPKKSLNSTNWGHDLWVDRAVLLEREKNPCFRARIKEFYRRTPTWSLQTIMGMQRACSEREMHPDHFSVGDFLPAKRCRLPKQALFAKNQVYCFLKTAYCTPFGQIRLKSVFKKCANRPFWTAFGKDRHIIGGYG